MKGDRTEMDALRELQQILTFIHLQFSAIRQMHNSNIILKTFAKGFLVGYIIDVVPLWIKSLLKRKKISSLHPKSWNTSTAAFLSTLGAVFVLISQELDKRTRKTIISSASSKSATSSKSAPSATSELTSSSLQWRRTLTSGFIASLLARTWISRDRAARTSLTIHILIRALDCYWVGVEQAIAKAEAKTKPNNLQDFDGKHVVKSITTLDKLDVDDQSDVAVVAADTWVDQMEAVIQDSTYGHPFKTLKRERLMQQLLTGPGDAAEKVVLVTRLYMIFRNAAVYYSLLTLKTLVKNLDTVLFTTSCFEIMISWFYDPSSLPPAYSFWISKMAGIDSKLLQFVRDFYAGYYVDPTDGSRKIFKYGVHSDHMVEYAASIGIPATMVDPGNGLATCAMVHPVLPSSLWHNFKHLPLLSWIGQSESCSGNFVRQTGNGILKASAIYVPVHAITLLAVSIATVQNKSKRKSTIAPAAADGQSPKMNTTNPSRPGTTKRRKATLASTLARLLVNITRSSLFLGTFIAFVYTGVCVMRQTLQKDTPWGPRLGSLLCGLSLLIEKKSRRMPLALYVVPRAIYSCVERGVLRPISRLGGPSAGVVGGVVDAVEMLVFACSLAYLLACSKLSASRMRFGQVFLRWWLGP